jgi:ectoine hydroxylase-related dioxygenase (phytanoyl-CoA dioxygenase family)
MAAKEPPMSLSPDQVAQYRDLGYAVVPDLFDAEEAAAMQLELERMLREGKFWDVSLQPTAALAAMNLHSMGMNERSPLFAALMLEPRMVALARELVGDPLVFQQDQILLKPARVGRGTGWHQDNAYFSHPDPTRGVGIWIAIHPATVANGTMHVIPRSHHRAIPHEKTPGTAYLQNAPEVREEEAVAIELPAGGALLFNNGVLHCTKDNLSEGPRAAVALHYVNGEAVGPDFWANAGPQRIDRTSDAWRDEVRRTLDAAALSR